jgi:hypothetical protein
MAYVLMSILVYAGRIFDYEKLNAKTDPNTVNENTMMVHLNEHRVPYHPMNVSYEEVLTGNGYIEKLILLVYTVIRNKKEENLNPEIPKKWTHYALFLQANRVLLTFNHTNTSYKIGNIGILKSEDGTFDIYATKNLNKKIVPVRREKGDNQSYLVGRKMNFCKAYVIEKN